MEKELRLRISTDLKNKIKKQADKLNITVSAYVRMVLSKQDD